MALVGNAIDMVRTDPKDRGVGSDWKEILVTAVFWDVMDSEAVFYPFYTWIMSDSVGNNELVFSYNGADYIDNKFDVDESTTPESITPEIIKLIRDYQG